MTRRLATFLLFVLPVLAACAGAASSPPPSSPPTPGPTLISSPEDAAARVMDVHPELAGIPTKDPNVIGACCYWEGSPTGDGFTVRFEVGWGDCPSGCIDRHSWTFAVSSDGAVTLLDEQGSPVPSGVPGAGMGAGAGGGSTGGGGILPGGTGIQGHAMAGPTCPVARPNDPACADRPVAGATLVFLTAGGVEAARTMTDADGFYSVPLPPGPYTIEPQPVEGIMHGSPPIPVVVNDGVATVDIPFDTGIR
ncbi:MAG TPA: carboxypeptidase-like regulatory domain-containing protein [Candidatus Limnocylindrales bacterium]|nr:carboxypeptidase-like regulatory domain-containing protein [Candidatus Limnocylindrales bacterium]